jgi:hypothetical protein
MPCAALAIDFWILAHLRGIGFSVFVLILNLAILKREFEHIIIIIRIFGIEIVGFTYWASHGDHLFKQTQSPPDHPEHPQGAGGGCPGVAV